MSYGPEYFQTRNYTDYLDRKDRYLKLATDIDRFLDSIAIDAREQTVLDFGCGVGFLVDGLRRRGYQRAWGYDISSWAVKKSAELGIVNVTCQLEPIISEQIALTIMLDVLEHITLIDVTELLRKLKTYYILVRIPVSSDGKGEFHYEVSRRDPTHITALTKQSWIDIFEANGYEFLVRLNLPNIWDSPGVFCALFRCIT